MSGNCTGTVDVSAPAQTATLVIDSTPSGATVFYDNLPDIGWRTPTTQPNLAPGGHTITLSISGYQNWSTSVVLTNNQTTTINATLVIIVGGDMCYRGAVIHNSPCPWWNSAYNYWIQVWDDANAFIDTGCFASLSDAQIYIDSAISGRGANFIDCTP